MAVFDRDPLGEQLDEKERAEEDVFFGRRDQALIARIRARRREAEERRIRQLAHMRCPECGEPLTEVMRRGVKTESCPRGHGLWIPPGALETIRQREHDAWFDRYVHMRW